MTPIIFLDVDGVLNNPGQAVLMPRSRAIDPDMVARVWAVVLEAGAEVVLSSGWRYSHPLDEMRQLLAAKGFAEPERLVDRTGTAEQGWWRRGDEVRAYLTRRFGPRTAWPSGQKTPTGAWPPFVILDDSGLEEFEGLGRNLLQTDGSRGITARDCEAVRRVLERQREPM